MSAQDRSQELKGLAANLVANLSQGHGEQWDRLMAAAARFHKYSASNQLLIHAQLPTAAKVAGFKRWLDGRHVVKGGRALWIWAPCPVRKVVELENGEEQEVTRTFFRPTAVSIFRPHCVFAVKLPNATTCQRSSGPSTSPMIVAP
jgi:hypothetical protein